MRKQNGVCGMIVLGVLGAVISGCAANASGKAVVPVTMQIHNSERVEILWANVYRSGDRMWASGMLKQRGIGTAAVRTHVDVEVTGPDKSLVYTVVSEELRVPRVRLGKGADWKRFRVMLPDGLPAHARVRFTVHSGPHEPAAKVCFF